jgi:hypothetical protein
MWVHRPKCVADEVFMLEVDPIVKSFSFSAFPPILILLAFLGLLPAVHRIRTLQMLYS